MVYEFSNTEKHVLDVIEKNAVLICSLGNELYNVPELGYKEEKTSKIIQREFQRLGIPFSTGHALTGVRGQLSGQGNHNVAVIGELDSVVCRQHPCANPITGAVHACGHHAQLAAMIGVAIGLSESNVMSQLGGNVIFFAVPAEEYIDMEYRRELVEGNNIECFGGKQQLIKEGAFHNIDAVMMVHAQPNTPAAEVFVHGGSLGFIEKKITFHGKAAHASEPDKGINALNAAALAILGMHTNRERFREKDKIRVHPIITKGGDVVNSVPDEVCMESYVRGSNMDAITRASEATDRVIYGAAQMVGATAIIDTVPGYAPLKQNHLMGEMFKEIAKLLIPEQNIHSGIDMVGSTDMGDLSEIIPCIQPTMGGFDGDLHSKDFKVTDPYVAYVLPAKIMAIMAIRLLQDHGEKLLIIKENHTYVD